MRRSEECGGFR